MNREIWVTVWSYSTDYLIDLMVSVKCVPKKASFRFCSEFVIEIRFAVHG